MNNETEINFKENAEDNEVFTRFYIRGKKVDPEKITKRIGIVPSHQHKNGECHGPDNELKWNDSIWIIDSSTEVQSKDAAIHLKWILDQLDPVKSIIRSMMREEDIQVELKCIFLLFSREWEQHFNPELIKRIIDLNIGFGIYYHYLEY